MAERAPDAEVTLTEDELTEAIAADGVGSGYAREMARRVLDRIEKNQSPTWEGVKRL